RRRDDAAQARDRLGGLLRSDDSHDDLAAGLEDAPDDEGPGEEEPRRDGPGRAADAADLEEHADRLDRERSAAATEHGSLTGLVTLETELPGRRAAIATSEAELADLDARIEERTAEIAALPGRREVLTTARAAS